MNRARLLPAAFLALVVACTSAYSTPADPPAATPSIDDLIAKVVADRAQVEKDKAALAKSEADLQAAVKTLVERLAALGITLGPPVPVDPLVAAVQSAFTADPSATKLADAQLLAKVYRQIAAQMAAIDTTATLAGTISSLTKSTLAGRFSTVATLLGKDFIGHIPAGVVALTDAQKAEAAAALTKYAAILEGVY